MIKIEIGFIISMILFATFILMLFFTNDKTKSDLELVQAENKILKDKIRQLDFELRCYKTSRIYKPTRSAEVSHEDFKNAVRFAMKKSHPDNGGSAEEFDKFRKLYERIK